MQVLGELAKLVITTMKVKVLIMIAALKMFLLVASKMVKVETVIAAALGRAHHRP